ncbi:peptidase M15B and M15C DD-carboxypeptidase VanY/endolysin [Paenibacillus curdlanolyticus YK9]|uniref:Peptidase M15B and M15C DD-carboxypeptidase VanY/endolysin n=1 Tax=Paenibacillus curdlanolyticus YK9 TaxID=717606 RepID=E0IB97_9BACL|nr:D-alanyl-D-alanine carboxypeptidase family protein [Paenibacillus curdlanolyticus]EFM10388.1 peptidase M15B and M15C DD-carboxypeptidase VanY/endolysin [Paenibacillus curdlanolyticus YK9]
MKKMIAITFALAIILAGTMYTKVVGKDTEPHTAQTPTAEGQQSETGTEPTAPAQTDKPDEESQGTGQLSDSSENQADGEADGQSGKTDRPSDSQADGKPASTNTSGKPSGGKPASGSKASVVTAAKPEAVGVLVNKTHRLPAGYVPRDLVYPDVPFIFSEKADKRKMRKEAAAALKELFDGASKDGISLAGVSGYRSEARQKTLFNNYVKRDGEAAAARYSARPGFSEHQTGLAIDVSGTGGKCAAEDCFADTDEAKWLADHSFEYGFIIRYPANKEKVTGYKYESWHLRYVGVDMAVAMHTSGLTLEEYTEENVTN